MQSCDVVENCSFLSLLDFPFFVLHLFEPVLLRKDRLGRGGIGTDVSRASGAVRDLVTKLAELLITQDRPRQ